MHNLKTFYAATTITSNDSEEIDIEKIYLEYYKTKSNVSLEENSKPYGVEIVKKKQLGKILEVEKKEAKNILVKEKEADNILKLLVENKVTPISLNDVLEDLVSC